MKKQVFFFIFLIAAFPIIAQPEQVSFSLDAPDQVTAGQDFEVTLTFRKGMLEDYSRFSQDLPLGFTAENISSPNADFSFSEQRVRIIWLKLPDDQEIEVKYLISVDPRLRGQLDLSGTFAYVVDGERAYLNLPEPEVVNILPDPGTDPSLVVDIQDFPHVVNPPEGAAPDAAFATVIRQEPEIESNGLVYITLLIQTPAGTSFLKLEESIPGGYSFESLQANGAVVSQAASLARFVWMRAPAESIFLVKYRLVPILEETQERVVIDGTLSYTEGGSTKVAKPRQMKVDLGSLDPAGQLALLNTGKVPDSAGSRETGSSSGRGTTTQSADSNRRVDNVPPPGNASGAKINGIDVLPASSGVVFRVQVAAVRNPYFAGTFFESSELLKDVRVEKENGWHKYTVGPVSSYQEAERLKNRINASTRVNDAFIVAYRNGRRVALEDVL